MSHLALQIAAIALALNVATAVLFWWDKRAARRGTWRIRESTLLILALLGGWPGAKWAQHRLRHKSRKAPFRHLLNAVPLVWTAVAGVVLWAIPI